MRFRFHPYPSTVTFHYSFANCKTYTGAAILLPGMEPLEYLKYFIKILFFNPNAIVLNGKDKFISFFPC